MRPMVILFLGDHKEDVESYVANLRTNGILFRLVWVLTRSDLLAELAYPVDILLIEDSRLVDDETDLLGELRKTAPGVPVILFNSENISHLNRAVEILRAGAVDTTGNDSTPRFTKKVPSVISGNSDCTESELRRLYEMEHQQRELAEALRETSLAINASLDLDTVLDRIMEQVGRVVPYDSGSMLLVENGYIRLGRLYGYERYFPGYMARQGEILFEMTRIPNLAAMARTREAIVIPDTSEYPDWVITPETAHIHSWVGAPVISQGEVIAVFSLDKTEPNFYTTKHAERLSLFSAQAALAMDNSRQYAQMLDFLARERRLIEVAHIISSSLDLPTILNNVVRLACELVGAEAGSMALTSPDGETISYPYVFNLPGQLTLGQSPKGEGLSWQIVEYGQTIFLPDYSASEGAEQQWIDAGACAFIGVPLVAGKEILGGIALFSLSPEKQFSPRDVEFAKTVGQQAGVAISNARLYSAMRRQAQESETLRQAAAAVTSALDLNQVLDRILVNLESVIPYDSAAVFLLENNQLRIVVAHGFENSAALIGKTFPADDKIFSEIHQNKKVMILEDAAADPRFGKWGNTNRIHSWMGVPLMVRGNVIGYMTIDSSKYATYGPDEGTLAQAFTDEVSIAIEHARLFKEVQLMAITDPLTGLYNRRYFFELARHEIRRAVRYREPLSLIMLDLDNLKKVNDTYGHFMGDQLIKSITSLCLAALRSVDMVARIGGDEFVIMLPNTPGPQAAAAAKRLCQGVAQIRIPTKTGVIQTTVSIGVVQYQESFPDIDALLARADEALYLSKASGKNRVTVLK